MEPIAIIGMGCRFPGEANNPVNTPEKFWQLLCTGKDIAREIPAERWDIDAYYDANPEMPGKMYVREGYFLDDIEQFDPQFFNLAPREAASLDPQQRLVLEVSWETLEYANIVPSSIVGSQTGIFVSTFWDDYSARHLYAGAPEAIDRYSILSNQRAATSGRLAHLLGVHGPNVLIDTACSSSLTALHLACQTLQLHECDMALAGGVYLMVTPELTIGLCQMGALSADGRSKAFDHRANGFALGEGCGMVLLKRLADAQAEGDIIHAVIRGSAINHDGRSRTITTPNGRAQVALLRQALERAGVAPHQVQYVEAHGTGTELGDPIEVFAIADAIGHARTDPLAIGSVKTNIGHLNSAAGIAGLLKVVLALKHGAIPPTLHIDQLNPRIPWQQLAIAVPMELTPWSANGEFARMAGVSSFGLSGSNAHILIEEAPCQQVQSSNRLGDGLNTNHTCSEKLAPTFQGAVSKRQPEQNSSGEQHPERPYHLLPLSAKTIGALQAQVQSYHDWLHKHAEYALADICHTATTSREHFDHRLALVASSTQSVIHQLSSIRLDSLSYGSQEDHQVFSQAAVSQTRRRPFKIAFLFTGQGSQYEGMGRGLYETEPTFRSTIDLCDEVLQRYLDRSLLEILYATDENNASSSLIDQTTYTQPALFALEYALVKLWQSWGIQPDIVMGHSIGEIVAACIAGVFRLDDALKLVAARGRLMGQLPLDGAMVSLSAEGSTDSSLETRVQQAIDAYYLNSGRADVKLADAGTSVESKPPPPVDVSIAAVNTVANVVISGKREALLAIADKLALTGIKPRKLTVSHAFHSPLMAPILDEFRQVATSITYHKPTIPLVSTVTGGLADDELLTPEYWIRHVCQTVRFAEGVATLHQLDTDIFLEIGPKPILLGMVEQVASGQVASGQVASGASDSDLQPANLQTCKPATLPSLRQNQNDWQQMLSSLGELYVRGVAIDWSGVHGANPSRKVVLPTYPFQRQRCWLEMPQATRVGNLRPLVDQMMRLPRTGETVFETAFSVSALPYLADHRVYGTVVSPGACQIAMVANAAELLLGAGQALRMTDIVLPQALALPDGENSAGVRTVQAAFMTAVVNHSSERTTSGRSSPIAFQLSSFDPDSKEAEISTHVTGQVCVDTTAAGKRVDVDALRTQCTTAMNLADFYQAAEPEIELGLSFRWLTEAWLGKEEAAPAALARIVLPNVVGTMAGYRIHPGLLDACLQVAALATHETENSTTMLPFALGALHLYESIQGENWWCHAQQVDAGKWHIRLLDAKGLLLVAIDDFEMRAAPAEAVRGADIWRDWLYQVAWQQHPHFSPLSGEAGATEALTEDSGGTWLILVDQQGIGRAVADHLRRRGERAILAYPAQAYQQIDDDTLDIRSDIAEDYQQLVSMCADLKGVVHLWSLDMPNLHGDLQLVDAAEQGCGTTLHLVQALLQANITPEQICLVTQDAQPVVDADRANGALQAGLWGMGKVIALEHPELNTRLIDLDGSLEITSQAEYLYAEVTTSVAHTEPEPQIALRREGRYLARLARLEPQPAPEFSCQAEATYLITGGLGGLGLAIAERLVAHGAKHLLLIGRSQPKPDVQEQLKALSTLGVEISVAQCDVTDHRRLQQILEEINEDRPLRGIIHSVGVLDDGALLHQSWSRFAKVLAPKIQGAWHLHELTLEVQLDFFVLFSSVASLLGNRGQANHAAANGFLDAFAHYRQSRGLPALSINWSGWSEIGAAAEQIRTQGRQMAAPGTRCYFPPTRH